MDAPQLHQLEYAAKKPFAGYLARVLTLVAIAIGLAFVLFTLSLPLLHSHRPHRPPSSTMRLRMIATQAIGYSTDYNGEFPDSLDSLVQSEWALPAAYFSGQPVWLGTGLTMEAAEADTPLVYEGTVTDFEAGTFVAFVDASVKKVKGDELRKLLTEAEERLKRATTAPATQPATRSSTSTQTATRPARLATVEFAMVPGETITATTSVGQIQIRADDWLKRSYTWAGATRSVVMWPREERWYGSLGVYFPGPGQHWEEHDGITRAVVQEGQQHFESVEAAMEWISKQQWMPHVYTSDGIVVGWTLVPEREQLNVDVWQIMVNGQKPVGLPGASAEAVRRIQGTTTSPTSQPAPEPPSTTRPSTQPTILPSPDAPTLSDWSGQLDAITFLCYQWTGNHVEKWDVAITDRTILARFEAMRRSEHRGWVLYIACYDGTARFGETEVKARLGVLKLVDQPYAFEVRGPDGRSLFIETGQAAPELEKLVKAEALRQRPAEPLIERPG